jgi:hypothetical protein
MNSFRATTPFLILLLSMMVALSAQAQYNIPQKFPYDTTRSASDDEDSLKIRSDSTKSATDSAKAVSDSSKAVTDSAKAAADTTQAKPARKIFQFESPETEAAVNPAEVLKEANRWLTRMLFRGSFDATQIGAYASYQLTAWSDGTGSYGPVEARFTIYYLGSSTWEGKDAEWLQAVYTSMDAEPTTIEYDLIVPAGNEIKTISRALYRVDHGELRAINLAPDPNSPNVDASDKPASEGAEDLKLFSGMYQTEKYHGLGDGGVEVFAYKSNATPPLNLVRLGYGDEAMTLTSAGSDAAPRFDAPPPPGR